MTQNDTEKPELTEIEYAIKKLVESWYLGNSMFGNKTKIQHAAEELYYLTRKILEEVISPDAWAWAKKEYPDDDKLASAAYHGYIAARLGLYLAATDYAESKLPHWERFSNNFHTEPRICDGNLESGNHYIPLTELDKLPKED
jgi:hypothetical protein